MAGSASPKRMLMGTWDRITHNRTVAKAIWCGAYPEARPKRRGLLEKGLLTAMLVLRAASLSNLFGGHIDTYVVVWFLVISAGLFCNQPPAGAFAWAAAYRIVDIVNYQLCILLIDSQDPKWTLASLEHSVLLIFINLYEIVAGFAVIYLVDGGIARGKEYLRDPVSALYYSLATMTTLGYGDFVPKGPPSRLLVVAQLVASIVFALAIIPSFVATVADRMRRPEDPAA